MMKFLLIITLIILSFGCNNNSSQTLEVNGKPLLRDSNLHRYKSIGDIGHHSEIYEVIYQKDTFLVVLSDEGFHSSITKK